MTTTKPKIAIIEDDASLRAMYSKKFELESYTVRTAANGIEGLELIKAFSPEVILLDLLMPVMGGVEMLEELRNQPNGKDIKVIIMTNVDDNITTSRVYRSGPTDYLVKANVSPEQVFERVKTLIGQ